VQEPVGCSPGNSGIFDVFPEHAGTLLITASKEVAAVMTVFRLRLAIGIAVCHSVSPSRLASSLK
jgi:hypothetical protein